MNGILRLLTSFGLVALSCGCADRSSAVALPIATAVAAEAKQPLATSVEAIGITVSNIDRSVAFYRDVLTFDVIAEGDQR